MDLTVRIDDGIGRFTLSRAEKRNAINRQMQVDAAQGLALFAEHDVKVAILDAEGPIFCAGADLAEMRENRERASRQEDSARNSNERGPGLLQLLGTSGVFFIASVAQPALGLGVALAAMCPVTIASEEAWFSLPEIGIGMYPQGVAKMLANLTGQRRAFSYAISGKRVGALEAKEANLVTEVVKPDELEQRSVEWAAQLIERWKGVEVGLNAWRQEFFPPS